MADILTLAGYKTARGITDSANDSQLEAIIEMVNSYIESYCDREFGEGVFTERREGVCDHTGRYVFYVKNKPINSISAVQIKFFGATTPLNVDVSSLDVFNKPGYCYYSYVFNPSIGVIREEYRNNFYYDITYSGGQAVPKAVELAAITAVGDTFNYFQKTTTVSGSESPKELRSVKLGDYAETYATGGEGVFANQHNSKTGLVLTKTVTDLLNPFRFQDQSW